MLLLRSFEINGEVYNLSHNVDTDNRVVVHLTEYGEIPVLHIDSNLRIKDEKRSTHGLCKDLPSFLSWLLSAFSGADSPTLDRDLKR